MYLYTGHISLNVMDVKVTIAMKSLENRNVSSFSPYFYWGF